MGLLKQICVPLILLLRWIHLRDYHTAWFLAGQVEDDGLKGLSSRCGTRPARPTEVTQWGHSLASEIISGQPIIVHHSEGQTGTPVPVLLRADMAVMEKMESKCCLRCWDSKLIASGQVSICCDTHK